MQEGEEDYFYICASGFSTGCCLICKEKYKGCLCFECKCTKCKWYIPPYEYDGTKGKCGKVKSKEQIKKEIEFKNNKLFEKYKILYKQNEDTEKRLKDSGKIINVYSCQKCQSEIITEEPLIIVLEKFPICDVCKGKI